LSLRHALDSIATAAMIVAAGVVIWVSASRKSPQPDAGYHPGDRFEQLADTQLDSTSETAIVFVNSSCSICTTSMPFYRRLVERNDRTRVVIVSRESQVSLRAYLKRHAVEPHQMVSVGSANVKFRGTPTILLVDSNGIVVRVWAGKLSPERETEVLNAVM